MGEPRQIEKTVQLLVEGKDAERFMVAFLKHEEVDEIQVQNFGGIGELRGFLKALRALTSGWSGIQALGVIRDAEGSANDAERSVRDALATVGIRGEPGGLSQNVLIVPPGEPEGMLETMCLKAVEEDPVMECVASFLECVERIPYEVRNPEKSRFHLFLSSRPEPGLLLGEAASKGYLNLGSSTYEALRAFIATLRVEAVERITGGG
jgi:hypothetical protein